MEASTHAISEQFKIDLDTTLSHTEESVDDSARSNCSSECIVKASRNGSPTGPSILYRLAMALRYLWVGRVHELLESSLQSALSKGLLDSLLVCGGGEAHAGVFADIIKKYNPKAWPAASSVL